MTFDPFNPKRHTLQIETMSNPLVAHMTAMSLITTENSEHEVLKAVPAPAAPSSETSCSTSSTQPSESSSPPLHHYTSEEGHEDPVVESTYVTTTPPPISSRSTPNEDVSGEVDAPPEVAHAGDNEDSVLSERTSIGWGSIVIYMHPIVPGEHADCLYGPPVRHTVSLDMSLRVRAHQPSLPHALLLLLFFVCPSSLLLADDCLGSDSRKEHVGGCF
jgi:hypothetical protein